MSVHELKGRVEARDRLVAQAESGGLDLHEQALGALRRGDLRQAEAAIHRNDQHVRTLVENLRIYQAELYAQADELTTSQARTESLLTRFAALFANMPVAALLVGSNGEVRETNAQAQALLVLRPEGTAVRFMHRLVDPHHYQTRVRPAFHEALATGASALDSVPFLTENGRRFLGELHIASLPAETGQPGNAAHFACTVIDRTEHLQDLQALHEAVQALHMRESLLADAARLARTGGWAFHVAKATLRWSHELRTMFEIADDVPAGIDALLALCVPEGRAALAAAIEGAAQQGQPFDLELDMHSGSGRPLRVRAVGHPETDDDDGYHDRDSPQATRVIGVLQDISARHDAARRGAAEEAAAPASRVKSAVLSRMSHELHTPLNAILGFSQLMRMEAEAGDLVLKPQRVAQIEDAARQLLALVNDLLEVAGQAPTSAP